MFLKNKYTLFTTILISLFLLFLRFSIKSIYAENGCGGSSVCNSTEVHNAYTCNLNGSQCSKVFSGSYTSDCYISETDCYTYTLSTSCTYSNGECVINSKNVKSSCCGAPGGGGGYQCDNPQITYDCIRAGECPAQFEGPTCAPNKKWCVSFTCPACTATSPVVTVSQTGAQADISWTASGGASYELYVGSDKTMVANNCSGTGAACLYASNSAVSPTTVNGLEAGKLYYVRVVNYKDAACSAETTTNTLSCSISPNPISPLKVSQTQNILVSVDAPSENPTFNFSSNDPSVVSVSANGSNATLTALSIGSTVVNAQVIVSGQTFSCNGLNVDVVGSGPWWQVIDGDVVTNGSIFSDVPNANFFDLDGIGGFPGIPIYGSTFNLSATPTVISSTMWSANTQSLFSRRFDYNYFANLIPSTIIPGQISDLYFATTPDSNGYEWYKTTGPTSINALDLANRKVILFVDGDLTINENITLNDGIGFLAIFVSGNITLSPSVSNIEGLYLANAQFVTGSNGIDSDIPLNVRGSVASYGGISLQRDLADDSLPAETFEFAADQLLLFPNTLGYSRTKWTEVAP